MKIKKNYRQLEKRFHMLAVCNPQSIEQNRVFRLSQIYLDNGF